MHNELLFFLVWPMTAFKFHNIGSPKHQGNHPDDEGSKHL
jgi:hypothetical protein